VKIKGIKRGKQIELLNEINIPDGTEIYMEVDVEQPLSEQERLTRLNQIFGVWKNQTELDDIFAEIDTERHAYRGRALETLND
jgi:predicted HAD superfamily phosphohydrolase